MTFKMKQVLMSEAGDGDGGGGTDLSAVQAELESAREALKKANGEAAERRKALAELKAQIEGVDVEEYKRLKEASMTAAEKDEQRKKEYEKRLEEADAKAKDYAARYEKTMIDERLTAAFAQARAIDPDDCVALVRPRCGIDEDGVFIKGDDGLPMTKDGRRVSFADFAKDYLTRKPHLAQAGNAGSGSSGRKTGDGVRTITRSEYGAMNQQQRIDIAKDLRERKVVIKD